jgi:hypothetical protein
LIRDAAFESDVVTSALYLRNAAIRVIVQFMGSLNALPSMFMTSVSSLISLDLRSLLR